MKIVLLDADTLGKDVDVTTLFAKYGEFISYEKTQPQECSTHIADAQIVLTNKVVINKEVMDASPNLKLICITATGTNNVDLEYASKKGIVVKNVAGYSTASVAQTTFSLALYLLSSMKYYDEYVKSGQWSASNVFTHIDKPFCEIRGKTWGIVGLGNIGREVAKIASAFGANVQYYSTSGKNTDNEYKRVNLQELMQSDIISIHAPLNDDTRNLIKKEELSLMKEGGMILNLGRGGIINEVDLANALDTKNIYAGLDVSAKEPIEKENPLLHVKQKDRIAITPHIAWGSIEARKRLIELVIKNIEEFLKI